jgi:hypothetical protein
MQLILVGGFVLVALGGSTLTTETEAALNEVVKSKTTNF